MTASKKKKEGTLTMFWELEACGGKEFALVSSTLAFEKKYACVGKMMGTSKKETHTL
jgi:hypothetical protein